jgi:regulatory protein
MPSQSPTHSAVRRREKRPPRPLNPVRLDELALAYVARFATSAAKLETYLKRKLREREWEGEARPDPAAIVTRFVEAGYIDDTSYARTKSGSLLRRGYGRRRVDQALGAAGIAEDVRDEVRAGEAEQRAAALALARKRRFGPFGDKAGDRAAREKQLSAMLRAGHPLDSARILVNAASIEAAEAWAAAAGDDL